MSFDQYPSNSNKSKEKPAATGEKKKMKKVVDEGNAKKIPTATGSKLFKKAIADDVGYIFDNIAENTIGPMLRDMVEDSIANGIHMLLNPGDRDGYSYHRNKGHTNYAGAYRGGKTTKYVGSAGSDRDRRREQGRASRRGNRYAFENIEFDSKDDAMDVLSTLYDALDQYEGYAITVSEFYEAAGLDYTHNDMRYGWYDLEGARVKPSRGAWVITLPEPEYVGD